jgi:LysM repeat protein
MDPGRRRELVRYGAPALFLLGVTIAVLLVKSGLDSGSSDTTVAVPTTVAHTTTAAPTTTITLTDQPATTTAAATTTAPANAQYYVIESGDTLGSIASKYNTTVDQLMTFNPGIDPSALQPGQRIRVG